MDGEDGSQACVPPGQPYPYAGEAVYAPNEALQYAYEHDLTVDYTLNSFSIAHLLSKPVQNTLPTTTEDGFTDCSHLPDLELPVPQLRSEVLTIAHSALKLLHDTRRELTDDEVKSLTRDVIDSGNTKNLKLELPILRTDNERDMREFRKQMASRQDVNIRDHRLPLDPVTVEDGEGMQLPVSARADANGLLRKLEGEKLGVTRSSLQFLADVVKDGYTEEEQWGFLMEQAKETKWVKNPGLEKLEMPISPQLKQNQFFPSDDAYLIPISSDPSSSIFADDLKAAEEKLFEDYGDVWSEPTSPILDRFLDTELSEKDEMELLADTSQQRLTKRHLDDHKLDLPILPNVSPEEQFLPGSEVFGNFVADEMDIENLTTKFVDNFSDDKFGDELASVADSTMRNIEQEQLQAADATARVPVPIMDFSIPEPEWARLVNNGEAIFKWIQCGNDGLFRLPKWPRDSVTESRLVWRPIGSGASTVSTKETINAADALIETFVERLESGEVPNSLDFVQKRERLAILEHNSEDDEIETQMEKPKQRTCAALEIRKKRAIDAADNTSSKKPRSSANYAGKNGQSLLLGGSPGASAKLLSNFMELHAPKKKWSVSKYFPSVKDATDVLPPPPKPSEKPRESGEPDIAEKAESVQHSKSTTRAPYPHFKPMSTPLTIFISLRAPRHLIRALEGLLPGLSLMERDYNKHNTSVWSPDSVSRTEVVPPLAFDADLTLSPSTGVAITSMIMVRQKPRPQSARNGLQERIEKIALRYDRLIILVGGGGGPDDTLREMGSSDAAALTDFQGFASGLQCNILVCYIGGGDDTLSRWVASLVCRHGQSDPNIQNALIEAETLWELWLRRAGFNVYAAQTVAGQLKVPKTETDTKRGHHGLAAFVTMTRNERMRRFGPLVGPRVLERVSEVVDEIWNKA
ncbi:hypothetical protein INS49_000595 [Diaporthe citri]|uniref:uncharacterized protein n=1 Tax=Diaporthe citri TaxID=83186 RepID=UPI001C7F95BD|nr:uncharacterized protein INS49_000595 [Diaporthe citri]KAG6366418.1 hypothetical protein INS49_000595 [Diaporthe citri]